MQFTTYLVHSQDIPKFMEFRLREFPKMFPNGAYPPNTLLMIDRLRRNLVEPCLERRRLEHFDRLARRREAREQRPQSLADEVVIVDDEDLHAASARLGLSDASSARSRAGRTGLCSIG